MLNKDLEQRYQKLYNRLVPYEGKADTVEGEMLRAISKIGYRYNNDGDYFWKGYGTETAGPAHAYLIRFSPINDQLNKILSRAVNKKGDEYESVINAAVEVIVSYIENRGDNRETNTRDMWDCSSVYENSEKYFCEDDDDDYFEYDMD